MSSQQSLADLVAIRGVIKHTVEHRNKLFVGHCGPVVLFQDSSSLLDSFASKQIELCHLSLIGTPPPPTAKYMEYYNRKSRH